MEAKFSEEEEGSPLEEEQKAQAKERAQDAPSRGMAQEKGTEMEEQDPEGPGTGKKPRKGPHPVQAGSGVEFWGEAVPEVLHQDTGISDEHRQRFRRFRYHEAAGPREVCSQLHGLCSHWLEPERHTKKALPPVILTGIECLGLVWEARESLAFWLVYRLPNMPPNSLSSLVGAVLGWALKYPRLIVLGDFSVHADDAASVPAMDLVFST
ncbi:PREDICTED: SCAN domain-containing protein 1-like [Gekko japonicus]|uniref:SCAN domain-containing protein 1-like n=1 Tax=Gekko japonicus TaxID=146911 RepID=A0ABM1L1Q3_GEKJA|nr:PREDICTED: SCAN domain-containing protein 1-like [Gekko japonicus]